MNSNDDLARQSKSCRDLVEQAENLALADLDGPLQIPDLCRVLGVSATARSARRFIESTALRRAGTCG